MQAKMSRDELRQMLAANRAPTQGDEGAPQEPAESKPETERMWSNSEMLRLLWHPSNSDVAKKFFATSGMMLLLPLLTFYSMWCLLESQEYSEADALMWAGFASAAAVNVVLGIFCWVSYKEITDERDELLAAGKLPAGDENRKDR
eukprot:GDKH01029209.1.p1 GENE.GDKH01029209.1~~GDKH01029209.1.p1  ORF type:complete len:146 (-),score=21.58 GDKH01029209.1:98-535(-)